MIQDLETKAQVTTGAQVGNESHGLLLPFILTVAILAIGTFALTSLIQPVETEVERYRRLFIEPYSLRPETIERYCFLLFVFMLLPVSWFLALGPGVRVIAHLRSGKNWLSVAGKMSIAASVCLLQFLMLLDSEFTSWILPQTHFDAWFWLAASSAVGTLAMAWKKLGQTQKREHDLVALVRIGRIATLAMAGLLALAIADRLNEIHWSLTLIDLWSLSSLGLVLLLTSHMLSRQIDGPVGKWLSASDEKERLVTRALITIASASIVIIEMRKIQGISFVITDRSKWTSHFEAVFYSVSQVTGGRSLLADLPSQYGYFSELLGPWFRLIGPSVLNFSVTMFSLQLIAQASLLWVCWQMIRTPRLFMLAAFCLLALTTGAWHSIALNLVDPYYQYWPLRFFFPALSCLLFWLALQTNFNWSYSLACGASSGLAMIWNVDSGIPTFGALVAFALYRWVHSSNGQRRIWVWRGLGFAFCAGVVLAFFLWALDFKSGHRIQLEDAFKYQNLFYRLGFYMLPMPLTPSPWMIVLAYYVFGVVYAIHLRTRGRGTRHVDMVYYLSILGIGLFSYYQGRSHELNLLVVMWPAAMIGFILADRNLRLVKARLLPSFEALLALPILAFGGLCLWILVLGLSSLAPKTSTYLNTALSHRVTPVMKNIEFIKRKATDTTEVAIIAPHQAVYFAETGLVSAVKGPGLAEIALVQDRQNMIDQISSTPIKHLFVQRKIRDDIDFATPYAAMFKSYQLEDESEAGLQHWIPLRNGKPASPSN